MADHVREVSPRVLAEEASPHATPGKRFFARPRDSSSKRVRTAGPRSSCSATLLEVAVAGEISTSFASSSTYLRVHLLAALDVLRRIVRPSTTVPVTMIPRGNDRRIEMRFASRVLVLAVHHDRR